MEGEIYQPIQLQLALESIESQHAAILNVLMSIFSTLGPFTPDCGGGLLHLRKTRFNRRVVMQPNFIVIDLALQRQDELSSSINVSAGVRVLCASTLKYCVFREILQ